MSETRTCGECRGAGWVPRSHGFDDAGFEPCRDCSGTGKVWAEDPLRDFEKANERYSACGTPGAMGRTAHQEVERQCGTCPDTLATCSAPALKDEPPW